MSAEDEEPLTKAYAGAFSMVLGGLFYLCDCALVYSHGDHRNISFLKAGIYEGGPLGFFASAGIFVFGVAHMIYYGARSVFHKRP